MNGRPPVVTKAEALRAYGELRAEHQFAVEDMTPREQAEAAWSPTSRYSVDELEDLIRAERGYPATDRTTRSA